MCSVIDDQKHPIHPNNQSLPPEKQHESFAGLTSYQKVGSTRKTQSFHNRLSQQRRPGKKIDAARGARNNSTPMVCQLDL